MMRTREANPIRYGLILIIAIRRRQGFYTFGWGHGGKGYASASAFSIPVQDKIISTPHGVGFGMKFC
jgi:hypothetical protein